MGTSERTLVTGCAGFIGSHLAERLLEQGHTVVGVDCLSDFYGLEHKLANLEPLRAHDAFELQPLDLSRDALDTPLSGVTTVYHLAAQPGVRQSFECATAYVRHNVVASGRLLGWAARARVCAFVYASSSSVYGGAIDGRPMRETDPLRPASPYAWTKVAVEQLAHAHRLRFRLPVVGMRYFSVYGPRQRPDMAFHRFLESAIRGRPLAVLGDGSQRRDFTHVDDVVDATIAAASRGRPGAVYNAGAERPASVNDVLELVEQLVERRLRVERRSAARGDVAETRADGRLVRDQLGFRPRRNLADGLASQLEWQQRMAAGGVPLRAAA